MCIDIRYSVRSKWSAGRMPVRTLVRVFLFIYLFIFVTRPLLDSVPMEYVMLSA